MSIFTLLRDFSSQHYSPLLASTLRSPASVNPAQHGGLLPLLIQNYYLSSYERDPSRLAFPRLASSLLFSTLLNAGGTISPLLLYESLLKLL